MCVKDPRPPLLWRTQGRVWSLTSKSKMVPMKNKMDPRTCSNGARISISASCGSSESKGKRKSKPASWAIRSCKLTITRSANATSTRMSPSLALLRPGSSSMQPTSSTIVATRYTNAFIYSHQSLHAAGPYKRVLRTDTSFTISSSLFCNNCTHFPSTLLPHQFRTKFVTQLAIACCRCWFFSFYKCVKLLRQNCRSISRRQFLPRRPKNCRGLDSSERLAHAASASRIVDQFQMDTWKSAFLEHLER